MLNRVQEFFKTDNSTETPIRRFFEDYPAQISKFLALIPDFTHEEIIYYLHRYTSEHNITHRLPHYKSYFPASKFMITIVEACVERDRYELFNFIVDLWKNGIGRSQYSTIQYMTYTSELKSWPVQRRFRLAISRKTTKAQE